MNGKPDKIELLTDDGPIDITDGVVSIETDYNSSFVIQEDLLTGEITQVIKNCTITFEVAGEAIRGLMVALLLQRKTKNRGIRPRNKIR